jgi:hypothetical protein
MRHLTGIALAALVTLSTGCAFRRTPVRLIADNSVQALVGNWTGDYSSAETGRSGGITFSLASAQDTAYGDVTMVPRTRVTPMETSPQQTPMISHQGQVAAQPLTIRFVRLENGTVTGRLAPYEDPQCSCRVITTFQGRFTDADTIEGTYDTRGGGPGQRASAGKWKVTRQTSAAN